MPNALNQLVSREGGTGLLPIRGRTDEPSTVTVNGRPAATKADNSFEAKIDVVPGNNLVAVVATDVNGNATTNRYDVVVTGTGTKTLVYDPNGNLTSDGTRTFEWDALDRLTAVLSGTRRSEFTYNGAGQRTTITEKENGIVTSTKNLLSVGTAICEARDSNNTVVQRNYAEGEQRIANGTTTTLRYTRDHLGSIRELTDTSGVVQARYDYDPFGVTTKLSGDIESDFGYTAHYRHATSGLYLAPYRAYDPTFGRWISRDPIEEAGALNLFGYVLNDPINLIDPLGLEDFRMFHPSESWRRQFDSGPKTYDIGAHGNPNAVFDEHGNPMSPQDLLDRVKNDPAFQDAKNVRLWACEVGKGNNSFAQQFADLSGKPTAGPNETFWEHGRNGTVAPTGPNGKPPSGLGAMLARMFSWNWRNFKPR